MPSGNPALNANTFQGFEGMQVATDVAAREALHGTMTLEGTAVKSGVLAVLVMVSALFVYAVLFVGRGEYVMPLFFVGFVGGLVMAIATILKKNWAPVTAPMYAVLEGFVLGVVSLLFEAVFPGIVFEAVVLTMSVLGAMLLCYYTGLIKPTENLKLGIFAATGGIFIFYMIAFVMGFMGFRVPLIYDTGPFGILFSLIVVGIAALNLVVDFDFIERGVEMRAPKYMEWYAAFGLMVTLVWLYLELLRLLAKARSH
jgi:uncharacterized YccA/Bax inhibitor family protein